MSGPYSLNSNCPPTCTPCKDAGAENNSNSSGAPARTTCRLRGLFVGLAEFRLILVPPQPAFPRGRRTESPGSSASTTWPDNGVNDILGKGFNYPQNLRLLPGSGGSVAAGQRPEHPRHVHALRRRLRGRVQQLHPGRAFPQRYTLHPHRLRRHGTIFYDFTTATPGRLESVTDRYGNQQSYVWQAVGGLSQLASVTDAYGRAIQYSYYGSEFGYLLSQITDFLGRQLNFQYDNLGHLVAVVSALDPPGRHGQHLPRRHGLCLPVRR